MSLQCLASRPLYRSLMNIPDLQVTDLSCLQEQFTALRLFFALVFTIECLRWSILYNNIFLHLYA